MDHEQAAGEMACARWRRRAELLMQQVGYVEISFLSIIGQFCSNACVAQDRVAGAAEMCSLLEAQALRGRSPCLVKMLRLATAMCNKSSSQPTYKPGTARFVAHMVMKPRIMTQIAAVSSCKIVLSVSDMAAMHAGHALAAGCYSRAPATKATPCCHHKPWLCCAAGC